MKKTSRFFVTVIFFALLSAGMISLSNRHFTLSAVLFIASAILITLAVINFDKRRKNLKAEIIRFAQSNNLNTEFIFLDVNLVKAVGIDKKNQKVVIYNGQSFSVEDLSEYSGAEIEKSSNSNVTFYRKSSEVPVLKIQIRGGQFQDYSSYIQTVFN